MEAKSGSLQNFQLHLKWKIYVTKSWSHAWTHAWGLAYVCLPLSVRESEWWLILPVAILQRSLTAWRAFGQGAEDRKHCTDNHSLPSTWITVSRPQTVRSHNRIWCPWWSPQSRGLLSSLWNISRKETQGYIWALGNKDDRVWNKQSGVWFIECHGVRPHREPHKKDDNSFLLY